MPAVHTTISVPPELLARAAAVQAAAPIRPSLSAVLVAAIRAGLPGLEGGAPPLLDALAALLADLAWVRVGDGEPRRYRCQGCEQERLEWEPGRHGEGCEVAGVLARVGGPADEATVPGMAREVVYGAGAGAVEPGGPSLKTILFGHEPTPIERARALLAAMVARLPHHPKRKDLEAALEALGGADGAESLTARADAPTGPLAPAIARPLARALRAAGVDARARRGVVTVTAPCPCAQCGRPDDAIHQRAVVCRLCGNKHCPHAVDHRLDCSGSNEPGQEGSA